jgi:hypothetical protein
MPILHLPKAEHASWSPRFLDSFDLSGAVEVVARVHPRREEDPRFNFGVDARRAVQSETYDRVQVWATYGEPMTIGDCAKTTLDSAGYWKPRNSDPPGAFTLSYSLTSAPRRVASQQWKLEPLQAGLSPGLRIEPVPFHRSEEKDDHYRDVLIHELLSFVSTFE